MGSNLIVNRIKICCSFQNDFLYYQITRGEFDILLTNIFTKFIFSTRKIHSRNAFAMQYGMS